LTAAQIIVIAENPQNMPHHDIFNLEWYPVFSACSDQKKKKTEKKQLQQSV